MAKNKIKKLGILVGGGPAPGINGVIRSATIEAVNRGMEVVGLMDGFEPLIEGDFSRVKKLGINDVSRIHTLGGSILRTSRAGPAAMEPLLQKVAKNLRLFKIDYLITIGGDGTAYSSYQVSKKTKGRVGVVHVPKTIDNDLPLPGLMPTFGFHTARHVGTGLVQ